MKKKEEFEKVLTALNDDEKDKLLTSAKGLKKAQGVVRVKSKKTKSSNTDNTKNEK